MPNLIDLDISEVNITALPARAFYESTNVENLILPNTLTTIGASMFSESALKSVIIPNGVTTIESHAFDECKALISIEIPASVETIEQWAFCDCSSMKTVTFGKDSRLKKIGTSEYGGSFMRCTALTSIEIPANVETIGPSTFFGCTSLTAIEIPASVTTIGESAFKGCSSLTTVTFEKGSQLKTIAGGYRGSDYYGAFTSCTALTSIEIPASVETIEATAFYACTSLKIVTFEKGSQLKTIVNLILIMALSELQKVWRLLICRSVQKWRKSGTTPLRNMRVFNCSKLVQRFRRSYLEKMFFITV